MLGPIDYARYSNTANALAGRGPHWQIDGEIYGILNYDGNNPRYYKLRQNIITGMMKFIK